MKNFQMFFYRFRVIVGESKIFHTSQIEREKRLEVTRKRILLWTRTAFKQQFLRFVASAL